jgi:hypothetical protein
VRRRRFPPVSKGRWTLKPMIYRAPKGKPFGWPAPRCGAWGRQAQRPCRLPAMRGRARCHLHGGLSFGPPPGSQNGLVHGRRSRAVMQERKERTAAAKLVRAKVAEAIDDDAAALRAAAASPPKRRARVKAPVDSGST